MKNFTITMKNVSAALFAAAALLASCTTEDIDRATTPNAGEVQISVCVVADDVDVSSSAIITSSEGSVSGNIITIAEEKAISSRTVSVTAKYDETSATRDVLINAHPAGSKVSYSTTIVLDMPKAENLGAHGTSNSYLISEGGFYCFPATVRGNGRTVKGLDKPDTLSPSSAKLVWQTSQGMIKAVSFNKKKDTIEFKADEINGNALIAALDDEGNIIWSWHIWFPEVEVSAIQGYDGSMIMDMNLGAMHGTHDNVGSYGLLYQWGRKDPLPGTPIMHDGTTSTMPVPVYDMDGNTVAITNSSWYNTDCNTIAYSIANPTTCLSNYSQYSVSRDWLVPSESNGSLWGNPDGLELKDGEFPNKGTKTYFDPCPAGWKVPHLQAFQHFTSSGGYTIFEDDFAVAGPWSDGWDFMLNDTQSSYFPAAARYDGSYAMLMGSVSGAWGSYWFNTPSSGDNGMAEGMAFQSYSVSPRASGSRADAFSIRCIKE